MVLLGPEGWSLPYHGEPYGDRSAVQGDRSAVPGDRVLVQLRNCLLPHRLTLLIIMIDTLRGPQTTSSSLFVVYFITCYWYAYARISLLVLCPSAPYAQYRSAHPIRVHVSCCSTTARGVWSDRLGV